FNLGLAADEVAQSFNRFRFLGRARLVLFGRPFAGGLPEPGFRAGGQTVPDPVLVGAVERGEPLVASRPWRPPVPGAPSRAGGWGLHTPRGATRETPSRRG